MGHQVQRSTNLSLTSYNGWFGGGIAVIVMGIGRAIQWDNSLERLSDIFLEIEDSGGNTDKGKQ